MRRAVRSRRDQAVGDLVLDMTGDLANPAVRLALGEFLDCVEQDLRCDALIGDLETVTARRLFDFEGDDAGNIEPR